ncbi:MAG TPA: FKBP-type peptidyl-prolyl cis-trans isomerase [Solirubrobacterales bacterium]|nr:FKBP-type peptidyl-prolyl cis-trans isomerase [Solirubrobacterales bacterium]
MLIIGGLLAALILPGCGSDSDSSDTIAFEPFDLEAPRSPIRRESDLKIGANGLAGPESKPIIPDRPPPEFLISQDLIDGIGRLARTGDTITVQYVGYGYDSKKKFASSWDEGKPFTFTLGNGEVSQGWEEGVYGMEVSDRRELVIPPDLAAGGPPKDAPKGETLVYVVDSLNVEYGAAATGAAGASQKSKPKVSVPSGPPPKELVVKDLEKGTGAVAKSGDQVTVQYVGVDYKTGKQFDASWDRGEPIAFTLGAQEVIPGWDQGIEGMKVGGRRELIIPPDLAYGSQGSGPIAPNSTLVFVVDLVGVQ